MWIILVIAVVNLAVGYALAVYAGYAPQMGLRARRSKPSVVVPTKPKRPIRFVLFKSFATMSKS